MKQTASVLFLAVGILCITASMQVRADVVFDVSVEITHNGKLVGQPMLRLEEGKQGQINVSGANAYSLSVLVRQQGSDKVHVKMMFATASDAAEPEFEALIGAPVTLRVGKTQFNVQVDLHG